VRRHGKTHQPEVAGKLRNAAIEKYRASLPPGHVVGAHFPGEHQVGEESRIVPRQRRTGDRNLLLDDTAARLDRTDEASFPQSIDQCALAGAGTAGEDEKALGILRHFYRLL
jgi:hypothetical protein